MIRRVRRSVAAPRDLVGPKSAGEKELVAVRRWLDAGGIDEAPEHKAYKAASVVQALERLFSGKCAYCESRYTSTEPIDVEHWRPKGRVDRIRPGTKRRERLPGYPWLAADWQNLFASCIDCNRERWQQFLSLDEQGRLVEVRRKVGKGSRFPLFDEERRASSWNASDGEDPVLVNPCQEDDDPWNYFEFRDDGVVVPRAGAPDPADEQRTRAHRRALESIEIYALNRKGLVDERRERLVLVRKRFVLIGELTRLASTLGAEITTACGKKASARLRQSRDAVVELIEREIAELEALCRPEQPYSAIVSQFVTAFLSQLAEP